MTDKTFGRIKVISIVLGLIYMLGYIWFADDYLIDISLRQFIKISTGLALLIIPLIGSATSKFIVIRIIGILLGSIGILNNFHLMYIDLTMPHFPNVTGFILRIVVFTVLVIMLHRIFKPQLKNITANYK